jgi:hypothetical protein
MLAIWKKARSMSAGIRRLEGSSGTVDSTADVVGFPFREIRWQISQAKGACVTLRQSIGAVRRSLEAIKDDIGKVDDREAREALGHVLASMNESLQLRSDQLSDIEKSLDVTLRRTHRPRGG